MFSSTIKGLVRDEKVTLSVCDDLNEIWFTDSLDSEKKRKEERVLFIPGDAACIM